MAEFNPDEFIKQYGDKPAEQTAERESILDKKWDPVDVAKGVGQGLLDPFEGSAQMLEKAIRHFAPNAKLAPDSVRIWLRDYRDEAQSTLGGQAGEIAGNIGGMFIPGAAGARVAGALPRVGRALSAADRWMRGNPVKAGIAAGASQPVSGDDNYVRTKANQMLLGGAAGWGLPALAGAAARAGSLPAHWSIYHPVSSIVGMTAGPAISAAGRGAQRIPGAAAGAVAGQEWGQ